MQQTFQIQFAFANASEFQEIFESNLINGLGAPASLWLKNELLPAQDQPKQKNLPDGMHSRTLGFFSPVTAPGLA